MHAEDLDLVSGQIASHYERAGMIEQALFVAGRKHAQMGLNKQGLPTVSNLCKSH